MKFTSVMALTAISLMVALPAYAASDVSANAVSGQEVVSSKEEMRDMSGDIKAYFLNKNKDGNFEPTLIQRSMTAHGLLGETVVNTQGKAIATVKDIVIDRDGKAILVVVSDSGLLGIGSKVAAFNYNRVVEQKPDGKVVMILSQDMIDHAADFSYDQRDWAKAKVIPPGSISINALLKGNVLDNTGKKVADIENVYLRNADVSQIIVGFNKTLGMGGDLAAINYDDLQMIRKDKDLDFKLTFNQAHQFKNFKTSVNN